MTNLLFRTPNEVHAELPLSEQIIVVSGICAVILLISAIIGLSRNTTPSASVTTPNPAIPPGAETVVVFRSGKTWLAVRPDAEDIESSTTGSGPSPGAAVNDLLERQERGSGTRVRGHKTESDDRVNKTS